FEEWTRGDFAPYVIPDRTEAKPIEITLKRGLDLSGQMLDTGGRPVRDEEVNVFLDLHAGSHTGHGGEIFGQQVTTDRTGKFLFHHVYPNHFYVEMMDRSNGPPYWIRTRVRNRWVDKVEDEIVPRQDEWEPKNYEKTIDLRLVVARRPLYRYFGCVTDPLGRGVASAKVQIRCSLHDPERTFEDDHDYWWHTTTDRDGNYSLRVGSRFVNAIWVTAGDNVGNDNALEGELMAPGRYDITMRPKKKGE
ncbi:MAG: carboxypeptidase regulatory-like protein, partial [Spartobacteria bacterium]|nr:carboxypeptidase regulatory-like protein [Spartobacteria bacterium]